MPKDKDLKRLIRSRMEKTGESYTTARGHLLHRRGRPERSLESPPDFAKLAGMSDDAVEAKTGLTWEGWVRALDALGAAAMPHREIARHLHESEGLSAWWSQTVTVGYERIKGLREIGQRRTGTWEVNKSKTLEVAVESLYRAFRLARLRQRWLPGVKLEVRKATPDKSMRFTWEDATPVEVYFTVKGDTKSQVTIQHRRLASKEAAAEMRRYWTERLTALGGLLGSPGEPAR